MRSLLVNAITLLIIAAAIAAATMSGRKDPKLVKIKRCEIVPCKMHEVTEQLIYYLVAIDGTSVEVSSKDYCECRPPAYFRARFWVNRPWLVEPGPELIRH